MAAYRLFEEHKASIKKDLKNLKVIYTDLDGTLLNDKGSLIRDCNGDFFLEIPRLVVDILSSGIDLVMVSGRNKTQLRYNAQLLGLNNYIAELGCEMVYDLGKDVKVTFDDKKINYDLTYGGRDLPQIIKLLKDNFPKKIEGKDEWGRYRSYNALFFGEVDLGKANEILRASGYEGIVLVDNGFSNLIELDLDVKKIHIYNIIPEGVTKGSGVALDRKIRGFNIDNCIALGDSTEDLKIAEHVKYFFLMRDAVDHNRDILEALKDHDNVYVTSERMNRGWAEVMDYIMS